MKTPTPAQTIGPYFAFSLTPGQYHYDFRAVVDGNLILDETLEGVRIKVSGRILDGEGEPVSDAMVEIWQADANGRYGADRERFAGIGRFGTGTLPGGRFEFHTVKPGRVRDEAPHLNVIVSMRGLLKHAYTRIYFPDEDNSSDPVLRCVDEQRRATLIANRGSHGAGAMAYALDIHMQGERETVFFDL